MATQEETLHRLRRIEGQLRGIQRMIEEQRECEEVFTQLAAATAALRRAAVSYFSGKMADCLASGGAGGELTPERLEELFVKLA